MIEIGKNLAMALVAIAAITGMVIFLWLYRIK